MLSFGKSSSGRQGLIGRRKFDTLVGVGPRVVNDAYDPIEYERFMRSLTTGSAKKVAHPKHSGVEVHWAERDKSDLVVDDDDVLDCVRVRHTLRENRDWNAHMNMQRKITELHNRFWWMNRAAAEEMIKDEQRDKPKCDLRGHMFLESHLDGKEKFERYETREHNRNKRSNGNYKRPAKSWKSFGEKNVWIHVPTSDLDTAKGDMKQVKIGGTRFKANKQWATKKPKIHCAWTIGEETCATFLIWKREDDQAEREYAEMVAAEMERENDIEFLASCDEARYEEEYIAFDALERLYRKGNWCLANDIENDADLDKVDMLERHFDKGAKIYRRAA